MNSRIIVLIGAWIAMWFAFHFGHPIGYAVVVIGLAASIAIAAEELRDVPSAVHERQPAITLDKVSISTTPLPRARARGTSGKDVPSPVFRRPLAVDPGVAD
jgi:hypothetical protein